MHKQGASRSTLFLLELVIVILIFALCAAVCLSLFGASQKMAKDSDNLNHAVAISRTAASCYKAADGDIAAALVLMDAPQQTQSDAEISHGVIYYDAQWNLAVQPEENGFYLQIVPLTDAEALLQEAELTVYGMNQNEIFQLRVKAAVPTAGGELHAP